MKALILAAGAGRGSATRSLLGEREGVSRETDGGSGTGGRLRLLAGLAISVVSLGLVLWNVEWKRFWEALGGADYVWLLPALATVALVMWLKAIKWQILLVPAGKTSRVHLLYSMAIGYLVNTVLPGRLGELARTYTEAKLDGVRPMAVLSSVALDRILDIVALAVLLALSLPTANLPEWVGQSGLLVGAAGVGLLALSVLIAYPAGASIVTRIMRLLPSFPGKTRVERWVEALCVGMRGLRGARSQLALALLTATIWLVSVLTFYLTMLAFHIPAPIWASALGLAVTNLGMVVPSSPGYIGVFHYLVVLTLGAYGVEKELALGFSVVVHLVGLLPVSIFGAYSLWRCGLGLMDWRGAGRSTEPAHAGGSAANGS